MTAFRCQFGLRALVAICAALVVSGVFVACGSDDGSDTTASTSAGATTDQGSDAVAAAEEAVAVGYKGTDRALPDSSPKPVEDLNVWVIACTMQGEGCARPAQAMEEAGKALGWKTTIADGKLDPNVEANQIRNAISAGADVIVPLSIACATVPGALQAAHDAGVKLYGLYSRDCDKPLMDAQLEYGDGVEDLALEVVSPEIAKYVIAKTGGKAEIIQLFFDDGGSGRDLGNAFADAVESGCPDCEIHKVPITGQDIGANKVQALTAAALTKYPNANVVWAPFDGIILLGAGAAVGEVQAQGREVLLTGLEGLQPNLEMIAAGGPQSLAAGSPGGWHGWAAVDGINRLFAGEDQVDPGIGYQLIDKEHPPATVPYEGNKRSLGWKDNYRQIWGVEGSG